MAVASGRARHALGSLLLSISLALSSAWAGPMDLGGQFSVSESGAATYSIPVQVPPGTGGIEPKLALSYNSQTGNGLLGMGWSLSGLSAVTRCGRTIAQDGAKGGINFDANDRLCLDGQRLVAIAGTYGADGTEYRTERESFSKIISYGVAGSGPAWFKVWTKAGQILEYGNTADSRIEAQGKTSARVWAINKISDTLGNYLAFSYLEDSVNGDYVPSRIDYTGNVAASLTPNNSVRFVYEARPDSVPGYFAGSLVKSLQRLTTVQSYAGATLVKEHRLAYATSPSSNRSRLTTLTECSLPDNSCKPPVSLTWSEFGTAGFGTGSSWTTLAASWLTDVNGDGKADMVAQQSDGLYVALANASGSGVDSSTRWVGSFGSSQGYSNQDATPIFLIDINGDGLTDALGLASDGVYVALSTGSGFGGASRWLANFGTGNGWTTMDAMPRTFADVNGDGRPDLVGFKSDGVYVSVNTGSGFGDPVKWSNDFGSASSVAYATSAANPRLVQDMNGDGLPDLVGFANGGVYVGLNTGSGFAAATLMLADFGVTNGWTTQDTYPRTVADINGDGLADIVGFKNDGVYVSLNTGTGLQTATKWLADFGTATTTAYSSQKGFPRYVLDVNGDGKADIIGFAANGVQVALGTGTSFGASSQWVAGFGSAAGYSTGMPRQVADLDGDGFPDVVGTLASGTSVALSGRTMPPDWITAFAPGLGLVTTLSYDALTKAWVYTRDSDAVYPQMDLTVPLYAVSFVRSPNALGSGYTLSYYQYGGFRVDLSGRGALGFGWQQMLQADSNLTVRTDFRQDWPYQGLPAQSMKTLPGQGNGGLLSLTVNTYACINPQTGTACTVAAGNRYFPYASQTTEAGWDANGAALPVVATTNSFDSYGNATQVAVATEDGFTKTTTNTYSNDTTNWLLGRLTRSQVASESTGTTVPNMSHGEFVFTQTISANTQNYNLRNAAIAAGWDQAAPLKATVTINAGIVVSSTSLTTPAFDTGSGFPAGATLTLINNGTIIGKGGTGGQGYGNGLFCSYYGGCSTGSTPGGDGGPALGANATLTVTNAGTIAGGGGGGGGGGYAFNNYYFQNYAASGGGGGGGGAGQGAGGPAGIAANGYYSAVNGNPGSAGALTAGAAGGAGNVSYNDQGSDPGNYALGGSGGAGGGPGLPGATGNTGSAQYVGGGQSGGAAGPAVTGNINVTWTAAGTRLGPLVSGSSVPLALTAIAPNSGSVVGGTLVTLTGTGFMGGATVSIGGVAAVGCTITSSTRMTCLAPANTAGAKNVVVTSGGNNATLANGFTYQNLTVTAISPTVGSFAGSTPVTLTGTGFAPGASVAIGGTATLGCAVISSTSMTCLTAANSAGVKNVVVGLDETSVTLANGFTYQGLALTSVAPNQGGTAGGTAVTLTGTGFAPGATVTIGGVAATGCSVASLTSITCTTPASSSGAKAVVVSLAGSTVTLTGGYTYVSAFVFNQTISSNTLNYNLRTAAISAGWDQSAPLLATVTINAGVYVGSSSTGSYAFDTGASFPAGSTMALINNGYILGRGGNGGAGQSLAGSGCNGGAGSAGSGAAGGPALLARYAIAITNNGTVGGGGGGGGGGCCVNAFYLVGGGSGGGAGYPGGNPGGAGVYVNDGSTHGGTSGGSGTASSGGTSGWGGMWGPASDPYSGTTYCQIGPRGGVGGGPGAAGGSGTGQPWNDNYDGSCVPATPSGYSCYAGPPGAGGAAGAAIVGNANITWVTAGTRLGAVQ